MKLISFFSAASCAAKKGAMNDAEIAIIAIVGLVVIIVGLVLYIRALVNAANSDRWGWVILMLVLWPMFLFYRSRPREDRRPFSAEPRREPTMGEEPPARR
jgi:hypothetical protein